MISFIAVSFCVCVRGTFVRSFAGSVWFLWGILCVVYITYIMCVPLTVYRQRHSTHTHTIHIDCCVCVCVFAFCAARKRASVPIPPVARFYFEQLFQLFSWGSLVVQTVVVRSINGRAATAPPAPAASHITLSVFIPHSFHTCLCVSCFSCSSTSLPLLNETETTGHGYGEES